MSPTAPLQNCDLQNDNGYNKSTTGDATDDESLIDMFRTVASDPVSRQKIVLRDVACLHDGVTLGQLDDTSDKLARLFVNHYSAKRGSCIAIYMHKRAEYVFAYIAALKAGCAYLPLDISYPESLLQSVLNEVQPAVVCTTPEYALRLPLIEKNVVVFVFDDEGKWLRELDENTKLADVQLLQKIGPDDLAYIVYSSGTTGKPKGISCPHRGAVISYKYRFEHYPYAEDDVVACNVFFVWEMLRPILKAVLMVVIPDDIIYDPARLCEFLRQNNVTRMLFTPSLLETVLDTQTEETLRECFKQFRLIHLCGEVVTCALLDRFVKAFPHIQCVNLYSISETHDVAVADLTKFHARNEQRQFAPVGNLIDRVKVLILDGTTMKRVPIGVAGEIYIAGPTLALGYINRPELNRNRFVEVPAEYQTEMGQRMYRTGDWGYLLPNSVLEICGRCDTMVRIRGYSVELQAIEAILLRLPWVRSCAVESFGKEGEDKQLAAYIVLNNRQGATRKVIRAELKCRLPFYMVPQFFVFINKLPVLASSSKIDRKALPPVDYDRDIVEAEALPKTPTEQRLARIWADVLHHSTLDIQESFFDLGGHSLLAARMLSKLGQEFGMELTMRDLFSAPTVYAMARLLDGSERVSPEHTIDLEQQVETHDVKDNVMDLHLRAFWRSMEWGNRFHRANVLLTGVTGFLGSHLLVELLNISNEVRIVCLVRESSSSESVDDRLEKALEKRGLMNNTVQDQIKSRVRVVPADIALVQFGLSDENYHFLSYDIDLVIHAAAYVNLIYPYQALHGINVLGTRNVIDFCLKNKIKPLHYISTDAVIAPGLTEVDECFPVESIREKIVDGYGQSKYVAERLVLRSQSRGLPSIIYRLGNQAASSTSGFWNEQDFTYLMLLAAIQTGQTPTLHDWTVELTPVDFSSRFIADLATNSFCENVGKVFHLTNSGGASSPKWSQIMDWLRASGIRLKPVATVEWIKNILSCDDSSLQQIQKLLQVMIRDEQFFFQQTHYLRTNTDSLLAQKGLTYPQVDEHLVRRWIQQLIERKVISPPSRMDVQGPARLADKICIVSGASEGIGEAIAYTLAVQGGATVVAVARQMEKLEQLRTRCNNTRLVPIRCDVTNLDEVRSLVQQTFQRFGRIDVLVNCAGCMYYQMVKSGYTEEWRRQIDVNCHGTSMMIGEVAPHMINQQSGHILNITSDAGKRGFAGLAVYSGSKFFIEGFTQALRQELIDYNIRVTNIQPGDVATKLASRSTDAEAKSKYDMSEAGHKILDPDDVAQSVLFVLSQPKHVAINELLIEPQAAPI